MLLFTLVGMYVLLTPMKVLPRVGLQLLTAGKSESHGEQSKVVGEDLLAHKIKTQMKWIFSALGMDVRLDAPPQTRPSIR